VDERAKEKSGRKKWWMALAGRVGKYFHVHVDSVCVNYRDVVWQESRARVAFGIRMTSQEYCDVYSKAPGENLGLFFCRQHGDPPRMCTPPGAQKKLGQDNPAPVDES
jgi:hypothetical protein